MRIIDIRKQNKDDTKIVFADEDNTHQSVVPHQVGSNADYVVIGGANTKAYLCVRKGDVENLIKALQKAVELGWTK